MSGKGFGKDELDKFLNDIMAHPSGLSPTYMVMSPASYEAYKLSMTQPTPDLHLDVGASLMSPISGAEMDAMNAIFGNKFTAEVCNHFLPGQTYYADHRIATPIDNPFRQITPTTPWRVGP